MGSFVDEAYWHSEEILESLEKTDGCDIWQQEKEHDGLWRLYMAVFLPLHGHDHSKVVHEDRADMYDDLVALISELIERIDDGQADN